MKSQANKGIASMQLISQDQITQLLRHNRIQFLLIIIAGIIICLLPGFYLSEQFAIEGFNDLNLDNQLGEALGEGGMILLLWGVYYLFFIILGLSITILLYNIITFLMKINSPNLKFPGSLTEERLYQYLSNNFSHPDIKVTRKKILGTAHIALIFKKTTVHSLLIDENNRTYTVTSKLLGGFGISKRYGFGSVLDYTYTCVMEINIKNLIQRAGEFYQPESKSTVIRQNPLKHI
ncbi:hypothetical protein [Paenibacillus sp. HB172176]|uniref:hypothetical protein n=1 Tax=Paenibacillus sp. HB172176 TaxID=2493690 RepID=UPI001438FF0A|nr:hypothetical protein [Paenibacillus sp. HB172176]